MPRTLPRLAKPSLFMRRAWAPRDRELIQERQFPTGPPQAANSPIKVIVNGAPAPVLYAGGYPGTTNGYQVNFRLPDSVASGMTTVSLSAAWIAGTQVEIPVQ